MRQERLLEIVESFRRKGHDYVDEDCWYSCPAHEDYCGNQDKDVCLCGLAEHNARVDEALQMIREIEKEQAVITDKISYMYPAWPPAEFPDKQEGVSNETIKNEEERTKKKRPLQIVRPDTALTAVRKGNRKIDKG